MSRQVRRRLAAVATAATVGIASPLWGPIALRSVAAFRVTGVEVTGTRFVDAAVARDLASVSPETSVWDDHSAIEARLRLHPLIEDARVRRSGLTRLTIEVREIRPVALAASPLLQPVDGEGFLLPMDPAFYRLDLPILQGARVESDRVADESSRRVLGALERLDELNPGFVDRVSEVRQLSDVAIELILIEDSQANRVLLPLEDADVALLRVEQAIRQCAERGRIRSVDGRFRERVFVELEDGA